MASEPLKWVVKFGVAIEAVHYPVNSAVFCTAIGQQIIVKSEPDNLQHAVIWAITDNDGKPAFDVTFHDGHQRQVGLDEIYWKPSGQDDCQVPVHSLFDLTG